MWFYHSSIEYFHSQISLDNGCYVSSMRILCFASLIFLLLLFLNGRSPKRLFSYHLCNGGLGAEVTGEGKWRRCRIRIFIVHKEASFDLWNQSIHVCSICVSFLKGGEEGVNTFMIIGQRLVEVLNSLLVSIK